jgi:hypothetical protein
LRREENQRIQRKTLEARERIDNKFNSHMMPSPGIEPETAVVRGEHACCYMPPMKFAKKTFHEFFHF